jgi:hypothetical protein
MHEILSTAIWDSLSFLAPAELMFRAQGREPVASPFIPGPQNSISEFQPGAHAVTDFHALFFVLLVHCI